MDYYYDFDAISTGFMGIIVVLGIIILAFLIVGIIANWRMFKKAGKNGWECIVPIYGYYVLAEIAGLNWWWFLLMILDVVLKFAGGSMNNSTGAVSFTGNNTYGLTNTTDSHMMKNSEWGAVAYLSHSAYGINAEVGINSNSSFTTGAGDGTTYGTPGTGTNTYPQSTTGNITGVFDMSGGVDEPVMGNYNGTIKAAGFSILPESKYYDKYTVKSSASCTLTECGGHALYETEGWYSDNAYFVDRYGSWFLRGGYYGDAVVAGAFFRDAYLGNASHFNGFRTVLVKGT